ncbi:hypothetical protein SISSUDRAFT_1061405 [Sistotremastrum suecicum HHB10207 ss-3]|uniref:Phosphatidylserine decarboxylase proenzyme 2 n=1 Tax=Sistotremastrum suecicum HHB10207 ss-3 TaxID=1314776 RepID=A0A166E1I4_9AGAM|nr:hypothetical protein SISSUDRAFT_1061405 [Sistotremastrum suecicum HHB10207 ss-3]
MAPRPKALKLGRALKTAARLPVRVAGRGSGRNNLAPKAGEEPFVILKVQILACNDLIAKDKNGFSDPFVVASYLRQRHSTPVQKRTLNPTFAAHDATFEFPIYLSLVEHHGVLEFVVWDKDVLRKDYIGEASLPLEEWFNGDEYAFDSERNFPFELPLLSSKASTPPGGTIRVRLGFAPPSPLHHFPDYEEIYHDLLRRSRHADPSIMSAPATEGIGTIRSHQSGPAFEDDGLSSDDEHTDDDELDILLMPTSPAPLPSPDPLKAPKEPLNVAIEPPTPAVSNAPALPQKAESTGTRSRTFAIKRPTLPSRSSSAGETVVASPAPSASTSSKKKTRPRFRRSWGSKASEYNLTTQNDIMGIIMIEIVGGKDLPKVKNITRTGWDMDPFVVISFGKKVFRTRVIRHSLNPVWEEKLLFHVRRYETQFNVHFTVLDWDKLTSNDHVGEVTFDPNELLANVPKPDEKTGLYSEDADGTHDMKEFTVPLNTAKDVPWDGKHNPTLTFRAKYQPYDALRQRFWRYYLKQYDADDTRSISHLEISSMLDSLGSTLSFETIDGFFSRFGKTPDEDLTIDEAIICLETEVCKPNSEKKLLPAEEQHSEPSVPGTPNLLGKTPPMQGLGLDHIDFSGPPLQVSTSYTSGSSSDTSPSRSTSFPPLPPGSPTERSQLPLFDNVITDAPVQSSQTSQTTLVHTSRSTTSQTKLSPHRQASASSSDADESPTSSSTTDVERVINIKNCPLCHRPRLNAKAEMDIVTHLALCASQDWGRVDRIMVSNFVTPSQAQRKWLMKVISKVSSGAYQLGANSANIIVQNRMTGQLEEEKMQVYVRLGIRILYKGAKSRMEGARARRLLKSMSIKQGQKYDSPASAAEIPTFIRFHKLNVDEIRDPISSYKTFNQFFYRKLKDGARPVTDPDDPTTIVSAADCRLVVFESVNEATKLWIKGREFTVARLLGDAYKHEAARYAGGSLAIFRLAPQDYHRFHSPVDGVIGPMTHISGEYYTVNPQAIRTALDVYGENVRKIVPIDSPSFGRVMAVCIGAMMVGSILTTVDEGNNVARGQEFGYFAFGGSTIVLLLEKDTVKWDEDLIINGRASLETLVRVGMGIGKSVRQRSRSPAPAP